MAPTDGTCADRSERFYRRLLRLYPREFRRAYGAELLQMFRDVRAEPRHRGALGAARFWRHVLGDLVATAPRHRLTRVASTLAARAVHRRLRRRQPVPPRRSEMDTVVQDLKYALRLFRQHPGFTAAAVLSLALGIGGNSLMFGLVNGLVLRPFPYPDPDRLVSVGVTFPRLGAERGFIEVLSSHEVQDIARAQTLDDVLAFDLGNRNISGGDRPERVFSAFVWGDPFETFGMPPAAGRGFLTEETQEVGHPVAIISHRVWQSRFGGDPAVVGNLIQVNGQATTLVGVMPSGLLMLGTDLWLPMWADRDELPRNRRQFSILARLAAGATLAQANAELATIADRTTTEYVAQFPEYDGWRLEADTWVHALTGQIRPVAFALLGAVGLVLLIACANITNLLLARATSRRREIAVRLAMGAARSRLVRQMLTESTLLAAAGAGLGLLLAVGGLDLVASILPERIAAMEPQFAIDGRVLAFSLGLVLLCGVLMGLLPAWQVTRADPQTTLKSDGLTASAGQGAQYLRRLLVVGEVGIAVVLLVGAGLLLRSLSQIYRVDAGVDPQNVLTMRLTLPPEKYDPDGITAFFEQLVDRVEAVPGVEAVATASQFPPNGFFSSQFQIEGRVTATEGALPTTFLTIASPEYFSTLKVPIRRGRGLLPSDRPGSPPVLVVNETFAARYFGDSDPVGQRIKRGGAESTAPWAEIVGVAADTRNRGPLSRVEPEIFASVAHVEGWWNQLFLLVRTGGEPGAMLPEVRRQILSLDPEQPVYAIQTLEDAFATAILQQRGSLALLGAFAVLAVMLAGIGIYGVLSYSVTARTLEIGIRMALGAGAGDVRWMVVRQAFGLTCLGLAIGLAASMALGRVLSALLFGVTPSDPTTLVAVGLLFLAVSVIASYVPAHRASRVDPMTALRYE